LGHIDPKAIKLLEHQLDDFRIKSCDMKQVCESCIAAKMTRKPLPQQSESRSEKVLELIHTDVCGPMKTSTPRGNRYFMTLIDDYSKYSELYLLKNKSEVTAKVKEYVKLVQTKFNRTPKIIRSDNDGEYVNEELKSFFRNEGIISRTTVPYTPQQNGRSERKNRYLVKMARSMLIDAVLPNKYGAKR
jgi:transposase InsO family protein